MSFDVSEMYHVIFPSRRCRWLLRPIIIDSRETNAYTKKEGTFLYFSVMQLIYVSFSACYKCLQLFAYSFIVFLDSVTTRKLIFLVESSLK